MSQQPSASELTFRPMCSADLDALLAIERTTYHSPHTRNFYQQELNNEVATYLVLVTDSAELVGYVGYWLILDECSIIMIGVHPDWQGHGVGRRLMREALSNAAQNGATFSTLEVSATNTPAINLYLSLGYEQVGRRKRYYKKTGEDALLMTLRNDSPRVLYPQTQSGHVRTRSHNQSADKSCLTLGCSRQ